MGVVRQLRQVDADDSGIDAAFRADVHSGLAQAQKAIPARWFYDTMGSALFEDITALPEYYPTRSETDLLTRHAAAIADHVGKGRAVVELGSGSSAKTPLLLGAIAPSAYVPVDISGEFLRDSAAGLAEKFPGLPIYPVEADFTQRVTLPREIAAGPKLGFFPGSTIGNMVARTAVDLLRDWRDSLGEGALLLIGIDRIKDVDTLIAAYDDPAGVTAAFNRNLLDRINRELAGDIPVDDFSHRAIWNDVHGRIEMHLVAGRAMEFSVDGRRYAMAAGETIHSENSHKYGPRDAGLLLRAGGWTPLAAWDDVDPAFALILAEATAFRSAP
ncbi:L-histidine N(alpha)-methyltransferase [Sphingopyxis sp. MWB1]|uniref:L-histidine N(alpha)-methyltransferase n=1 Tax=Sphingopyxis sp. MWB1 TaxID=1537715 RepID=UPI0006922D10|nr:L-histidine N(alpha)-methyltransferase [Sphingopyxis sp. MWB1]